MLELASITSYAEKDIRVQVAMAKNVFGRLKPILTGGLRQETKKNLVKTSETWTLRKADVTKLEAFGCGNVWKGCG